MKMHPNFRKTISLAFAAALLGVQLWAGTRTGRPATAGAPLPWELTPTVAIYLALIQDRPPISDVGHLLITEVLYDPDAAQGDVEWIEIFNPTGDVVDLSGYKVGDEETLGGSEGMLQFPAGALIGVGRTVLIAADAAAFEIAFGFPPNFEIADSGSPVPEMIEYSAWTGGNLNLAGAGDEVLLLDLYDDLVDAVSWGSSNWAFDPDVPGVQAGHSIERSPGYADSDTAADWIDQPQPSPGAVDIPPPTPTPTVGPSPTPFAGGLLISEVLYDPTGAEPAAEWFEIHNLTGVALDLAGFKIGDEETAGGSEGMAAFPVGSAIAGGGVLVIANDAAAFSAAYGWPPDFELAGADPNVPDMVEYGAWSGGSISLSNSGDELLLLDAGDLLVDAVSWAGSTWAFNPSVPGVAAGHSIDRSPAGQDTDSAADWIDQPAPNPGGFGGGLQP